MYRPIIALAIILLAGTAYAHKGVKDPRVVARMDGMVVLGDNVKVLSQMARGQIAYDENRADAAKLALAEEATRVLELFEPEAKDPNSESKPEIWSDWEGFTEHARALEVAVTAADLSSPDAIAMSLRDIGRACGQCHEDYRE